MITARICYDSTICGTNIKPEGRPNRTACSGDDVLGSRTLLDNAPSGSDRLVDGAQRIPFAEARVAPPLLPDCVAQLREGLHPRHGRVVIRPRFDQLGRHTSVRVNYPAQDQSAGLQFDSLAVLYEDGAKNLPDFRRPSVLSVLTIDNIDDPGSNGICSSRPPL
jgi:hypothetical protein